MAKTSKPTQNPSAPALSMRLEFDRAKEPRGGSGFCRLAISVPQAGYNETSAPRRGLALAVALDCSGSMNEQAGSPDGSPMLFSMPAEAVDNSKIERCKGAVLEAIDLLGPDDMASLSAFSSMAKTLFPMSPMTEKNKEKFKEALGKISANGGTALHAGWSEAGREAAKGIDRKLLCRVALFTDGEATDGERNPEVLASQSAKLAHLGVSTSCFGVGARFNEDLMCAMADAGDGNFRYIPDAMLAAASAIDEVNGLGAATGRKAKLRLVGAEGVGEVDILNSLDRDGDWVKLPALLAGRPIEVVARIEFAASGQLGEMRAELVWENRDGIAQSLESSASVELASAAECEGLAQDAEVAGAASALMAAKAKLDMAHKISIGDMAGATASLNSAFDFIGSNAMYSGSSAEMESLNCLAQSFASGDMQSTRKTAVYQNYTRSKNQTVADTSSVKKK